MAALGGRFVQSFSRCGEDDEDLELQPEWEIDRRELQLMQVVGLWTLS